jgi:hypothetical protein
MQYKKPNLKKNTQSFVIFNLQYCTNCLWEALRHVYGTTALLVTPEDVASQANCCQQLWVESLRAMATNFP